MKIIPQGYCIYGYLFVCGRCDEKSLEDSFCKRVMVTRGDTITKSLDPNSAALSRDALAKIVYSRLFDWYICDVQEVYVLL